jgi:hypothetical protein
VAFAAGLRVEDRAETVGDLLDLVAEHIGGRVHIRLGREPVGQVVEPGRGLGDGRERDRRAFRREGGGLGDRLGGVLLGGRSRIRGARGEDK